MNATTTGKEELIWCDLDKQWTDRYICRYCVHYNNGKCEYMRMRK